MFAQQAATITEPERVKLEDLFNQADVVATIRIVSGDTEQYPHTVYKAEVLKPFKGTEPGATVFFGPYVSYGLGGEYLVFLRRSIGTLLPTKQSKTQVLSYGPIQTYYEIMYQGYGVMRIAYTCVFQGKEISQQCDNGIEINTYQVALPPKLRTSSPVTDDGANGNKKWVRKDVLLAVLEKMKKSD